MKTTLLGIFLSILITTVMFASEPSSLQTPPDVSREESSESKSSAEQKIKDQNIPEVEVHGSTQTPPSNENITGQQTPTLLQLTPQLTPPDMACILNRGILKVAIYDGNVPPFYFTDKKGKLDGIDVNIAKGLAQELGVKVEFMRAPTFDEVVELVKQGKADVGISKLSVTLERAKIIRYTGRYVNMGKAILINRVQLEKIGSKRDQTVEQIFQIPGAKIAVIGGSSFERFAKRIFPKTETVPYKTWDEVVDAVIKGEVLGAFRDEWEIRKIIDDRPDAPITVQAIIIKNEVDPIEMIVSWNSVQLAHFIDKYIQVNNINYNVPGLFTEYKKYQTQNEIKN